MVVWFSHNEMVLKNHDDYVFGKAVIHHFKQKVKKSTFLTL